jgi:hypothetical protein
MSSLLMRFRQSPGKKFLRWRDRMTMGVRLRGAEGAPLQECSPTCVGTIGHKIIVTDARQPVRASRQGSPWQR